MNADMTSNQTGCREIVIRKVQNGLRVLDELEPSFSDPGKYNTDFLFRLIRDSKDTEFGRKYHFADIHSVADFQRTVPLSTYDDYTSAIYRMSEKGETGILTSYPVNHYNKSSGTMGNPKRIPLSDPGMETALKYMYDVYSGLEYRFFGDEWIGRRGLNIIETPKSVQTLPCGATYGSVSARTLMTMKPILESIYTSPLEAAAPCSGTNTHYLHALYALRDRDVSYIFCSFFSFLLEQLRYIQRNWEELLKDIAAGTISELSQLEPDVKQRMESELLPMPERAEELRRIFERGFDEPFVPAVWPDCRFIMGIGTGGFKSYADKIRQIYTGPDISFLKTGMVASEGVFSVPFAPDCEDSVLIPSSVFFEFLPLDAGEDFSKIVTIENVEIGQKYEVIITNLSGFYRYRIRDAVVVTGRYKNTPTIQFLSRIDQTISIMGEKTTENALRSAVEETENSLNLDIDDFSVFPDLDAEPVRYVCFLEVADNPDHVTPKEIWKMLERQLAKANPSMGDKMAAGICGHVRVQFLEPETYRLYQELMLYRGGNAGQIKPVHIIVNERQRKFFYSMSEYMYEYVK